MKKLDLNVENKLDNPIELIKNIVENGLNIHSEILTKLFEVVSSDTDDMKYMHFVLTRIMYFDVILL
jgi:hypothetical protein